MRLSRIFFALILAAVLAGPVVALALAPGVPIGGKVVATTPCPGIPGFLYTVVGLGGIGSGVFWYAFTPTFLYGPPIIGRWVLGLAAPAGACGLLTTPIFGTSIAI